MGRIAVDVSTDHAALAEALQRAPAKIGVALDAWSARIYWQRPTSYSPHFLVHPEDVCTEFVLSAYSRADIDGAFDHVMTALHHIVRPNTVMEHFLEERGAAYVIHIYCYPKPSSQGEARHDPGN